MSDDLKQIIETQKSMKRWIIVGVAILGLIFVRLFAPELTTLFLVICGVVFACRFTAAFVQEVREGMREAEKR
jgi:hypothetical protein